MNELFDTCEQDPLKQASVVAPIPKNQVDKSAGVSLEISVETVKGPRLPHTRCEYIMWSWLIDPGPTLSEVFDGRLEAFGIREGAAVGVYGGRTLTDGVDILMAFPDVDDERCYFQWDRSLGAIPQSILLAIGNAFQRVVSVAEAGFGLPPFWLR